MKILTTAEKIEYLWQSKAPLTTTLAGVLRHCIDSHPPEKKPVLNVADDNGFMSTLAEYSRRKRELAALPPSEIDLLYALARNAELNKAETRRSYNQPNAQADFSHWAMLPHWTVDETAALLLGKNPEIVKKSYLEKFKYDDELAELERGSLKIMSLDATGKRCFPRQYKELFVLVQRSEIFLPGTQNVDPVSALDMAKASGISIPAQLEAALAGRKPRPVQALTTAPATVVMPELNSAPVVADGDAPAKRSNRKPSWATVAMPYMKSLFTDGHYKSASVFYKALTHRAGEPDSPFKLVNRELYCTEAGTTVSDGALGNVWPQIRAH